MSPKRRVLVVLPSLQPPGGGNGLGAWIVQALSGPYDVTVMSWQPVDLVEVNRFFGTSLAPDDFVSQTVHPAMRGAFSRIPLTLGLIRRMLLFRRAQGVAASFDLVFSADNEADFGRRGIQYITYPWMSFPRPQTDPGILQRMQWLVRLYYTGSMRLGRFSFDRMKRNATYSISDWTSRVIEDVHGIGSSVLYPVVPGEFPEVEWEEREEAFACVGRLAGEKRIEHVVAILRRVREAGHPVRLDLVGTPSSRRTDYYESVKRLAAENASWVTLHENLSRDELAHLLARHRYGIHGMLQEHFGMAVAEMVRAGCIVFTPSDGGQVEIVGDSRLTFSSEDEAVEKILRVLRSPDEQRSLREHLARRAECFAIDRFVEQVRAIAAEFIADRVEERVR